MRVWECTPLGEAQSSGDVVRGLIPGLDDPQQHPVLPLVEGGSEGVEQKPPGKPVLLGGDVEAAAPVLMMVEAHSGHDLAIHLAGDAVKVGHPHEAGTRMNPRMDILPPDNQPLSHSAAS